MRDGESAGIVGRVAGVAMACGMMALVVASGAGGQSTKAPPKDSPTKVSPTKPETPTKRTLLKSFCGTGELTGYTPIEGPDFSYDFYGNGVVESWAFIEPLPSTTVFYVAGKRDIVMDAMAEDRMFTRINAIATVAKRDERIRKTWENRRKKTKSAPAKEPLVPRPPQTGPTAADAQLEARLDAFESETDYAEGLLKRQDLGIIELTLWDGVAKEWRVGVWNDGLRALVQNVQPGDYLTFDRWGTLHWWEVVGPGTDSMDRRWTLGGGVKKTSKPSGFAEPDVSTAPWWVRRDESPTAITAREVEEREPTRAARVWGFRDDVAAVEMTVVHGATERDRRGKLKADVLLDGRVRPLVFQRNRVGPWTHLAVGRELPKSLKFQIGARYIYTQDPRGAVVAPLMQLAPGLNLEVLTLPKSTAALE